MDSIPGSGGYPGGGHGILLQDSCLENPMNRGTLWATVHGFAESWKYLKRLGTQTHRCFLGNIILQITIKLWSIYLRFMSCVNKHTPPQFSKDIFFLSTLKKIFSCSRCLLLSWHLKQVSLGGRLHLISCLYLCLSKPFADLFLAIEIEKSL